MRDDAAKRRRQEETGNLRQEQEGNGSLWRWFAEGTNQSEDTNDTHEEKDGTKSAEENAHCNCRKPSGCKKAKEERDAADGCKKTQEYLNKRWNEEMEQRTSDTSEQCVDDVSEEKTDTMQDTGSEDEENIKMMIRGLKESLESKREKGEDQLEEESKLDDREIDEERVEESKLARLNAREVFQGGVCRCYQLMMSSQQPDALQL